MPSGHVDLVDLHLTVQDDGGRLRQQPEAQLLGHGLHIRDAQVQLLRDLPVGEVETHQVQAQHPDP